MDEHLVARKVVVNGGIGKRMAGVRIDHAAADPLVGNSDVPRVFVLRLDGSGGLKLPIGEMNSCGEKAALPEASFVLAGRTGIDGYTPEAAQCGEIDAGVFLDGVAEECGDGDVQGFDRDIDRLRSRDFDRNDEALERLFA